MARTINEIKKEITDAWLLDQNLKNVYGIADDASWNTTFSRVSVENIICYIVAVAIWTHERLFDVHRAEVEDTLAQMKPHSLRWYVNKVKAFRIGQPLIEGTDKYDDTGLTNEDIAQRQVVHYAAATEKDGYVYIKVATAGAGGKQPLSDDQLAGLKEYIAEVKDAGVRVDVINAPACKIRLELDIYYNPMILTSDGMRLAGGNHPVEDAIRQYIENLPFNGEYRNAALIDCLQAIEGVVIPELQFVEESYDGITYTPVNAKATPSSGYYMYETNNITLNYIPYYESV